MVQASQRTRPHLRKPNLLRIDIQKHIDENKDLSWFEWQGDSIDKVCRKTEGPLDHMCARML